MTAWNPYFLRAHTRLDGLFFDQFLKHVPIIHPVFGRKQITEDRQLATIACALGSLAADDVPSGYMCATWMQTYKRVSTTVVRQSDIMTFHSSDSLAEDWDNRLLNRFSSGILLPSRRANIPVASELHGRHNEEGGRGAYTPFLSNPFTGLQRIDFRRSDGIL